MSTLELSWIKVRLVGSAILHSGIITQKVNKWAITAHYVNIAWGINSVLC